MQQQACVQLDIRACKAEEIFQEFIKYLTHSQMLDWTGRTRRESLLRNHNTQHMPPIPASKTSTSLFSFVHLSTFTQRLLLVMKEPNIATHTPCWDKLNVFLFFFFFLAHECSDYVRICFTGPPLKTVMSSFGRACHSSGGALSLQGVIFKIPFKETQMTGCGSMHL